MSPSSFTSTKVLPMQAQMGILERTDMGGGIYMIRVYSTAWCPECIMLKRYLKSRGVQYEDINVADRQTDRDEVKRLSGQYTVPILDIDGTIIVGFRKDSIEPLLGPAKDKPTQASQR